MNKSAPAIEIHQLCYGYDAGTVVLNDINLAVMEHEFMVIVGQNGSGKTTLFKNICGLLRPSRGTIALRGQDTAKMDIAEIAGEIGFVMQDPDRQLFASSVYDEVVFTLRQRYATHKRTFTAERIRKKAEEALSLTGMIDKRDAFPPALGRADRVKTVFASVLAMGPRIIILDEPAAGQDKKGCCLIMDILEQLHRQGYTIIMVTHNINIAAEYARRLVVMKDGGVCMDGKPGCILERTAELAEAGILPPQIIRLSQAIRQRLPLEKNALTPSELAAMLVKIQ